MEESLVQVLKWLFSRSDPMLTGCLLILGYWIWNTNKKIDRHTDAKNKTPHTACEFQGIDIEAASVRAEVVAEQVAEMRKENREDHQEIFAILRGQVE